MGGNMACRYLIPLCFILIACQAKTNVYVAPTVSEDCLKNNSQLTGKEYEVIGASDLYKNPSIDSEKHINTKLSEAIGETRYLSIDDTTKVREVCIENEWSWIELLEPDWLRDSHKGWVPTKVLLKSSFSNLDYDDRISATALLPYTKTGYPKTHSKYGERVPQIEQFRRLAALKALKEQTCKFVISSDVSDKRSTVSKIVIWVECKDGNRRYFSEEQLNEQQ